MPDSSFADRVRERLAELTPAEREVVAYLRDHSGDILFASADQIGRATGTSNATVIRAAKSLGYSGLPELKHDLGQGMIHEVRPSARLRQRLEHAGGAPEDSIGYVFAEAGERLGETQRLVDTAAFAAAVEHLATAREVVAFGLGLSAISAHYLTMRLVRLGRRARNISVTGFALPDALLPLAADDTVVMYVPGRLLPDCELVLDQAAATGARVVLVSNSLTQKLRDRVDVCLTAIHTPSGMTSESLTSLVLTDALLLSVAVKEEDRATRASERLTDLRERLYPGTSERRNTRARAAGAVDGRPDTTE